MGRDKRKWFTWIFVVVTVAVVAAMMISTLRRPERISLPSLEETSGEISGELTGNEMLTLVEITPETVQTAIATLIRPETYQRTVVVERFWSGGSGSSQSTVTVCRGWTRVDRTLPGGSVRHSVTDAETTYIWYDQESEVYTAAAGDISADDEQMIPTYENVLVLPKEEIVVSDYRIEADRQCIYVETKEDTEGYLRRFWIDLECGLLAMAEVLQDGETVYRMGATEITAATDLQGYFFLPDGTFLIEN